LADENGFYGVMGLRRRLPLRWIALAAVVGCAILLAPAATARGAQPLETAVVDPINFVEPNLDLTMGRVRSAGSSAVRILVPWRYVAPLTTSKPAGFDAANPTDPAYKWTVVDSQVRAAVRHHLKPMLSIFVAPAWAERSSEGPDGGRSPDPAEVAAFGRAIARRYSGSVLGLPRVRLWQLWNEPNIYRFLMPQFDSPFADPVPSGARALSPVIYRDMLNAFAPAVHGVSRRNVVITGGMTPFARPYAASPAVGPLRFMRELLCLTPKNRPAPGCRQRASFDVWAHHPYTDGGPNHSAQEPGNVSLGDLRQMERVLKAGIRTGHIRSSQRVRFWVTEISWDTNPPDPGGVPAKTHARWVAEAMYRMWRSGVSLVTWYTIRDDPTRGRPDPEVYQSGLYYRCDTGPACDRPKPALAAFRFPFVALPEAGRTVVWGRTPFGRRARVKLELRSGGGWRRVATLRTDSHGIFLRRLTRPRHGTMRAVASPGGARSPGFRIGRTRDMEVHPFG
jgi:hypothetical protein